MESPKIINPGRPVWISYIGNSSENPEWEHIADCVETLVQLFKENGVDHTINLKNIASGMKTMAAVVRAVENRSIRRGSLLIIDEPESNLHPEWQVKFAIFLVLLQKRLGVSILLNTHSPYFLRAISVYTKDSEVESHFYRMIPDQGELKSKDIGEESLKSYHSDPVDGNLEDVFRDMARPFDNLI